MSLIVVVSSATGILCRLAAGRSMLRTMDIRKACLIAIAAFAISLAPLRAEETETIHLAVGGTIVITLTENPSTGYRWQLAGPASRNLSLVSISDAGFTRSASGLIGAAGLRRFKIAARRAGAAVAVFDYVRPWEHVATARRHIVTIDIARR